MGTAEGTLSLRPIGKTSRGAIRLVFTKLAMLTLWALAIDQRNPLIVQCREDSWLFDVLN